MKVASASRTQCFMVITEEHSQIVTLIFGAAICAAFLVLLAFKYCVKTFLFKGAPGVGICQEFGEFRIDLF